MANFTDEIMALADLYAESLLRVARESGQEDEIAAEFANLAAYMEAHPDFAGFMTAAALDDDERRASLEKLFRGKMNDLLLNMLQVLNNRHRSELTAAVARAIELRIQHERSQQEIRVETAAPLADDLKTRMNEVLSRRIGKKSILIEEVRPELIGGIIVHVGDQRLDASLLAQVESMRIRLATRASHEIHKGDGQYVVEN